jgi:hypothetical protein
MTMHAITIEFDDGELTRCTDERLAMLWHVAQANPADGFENKAPGEIAERIGREIIRRWLRHAPIEMYHHQGRHYSWKQLTKFAQYEPGGRAGTPEWEAGQWVPRTSHTDETSQDGGDVR